MEDVKKGLDVPLQNWRTVFKRNGLAVDYWNKGRGNLNFEKIGEFYRNDLFDIFQKALDLGITSFWFFFEPDVEITWLSDDINASFELIRFIDDLCEERDMQLLSVLVPSDGNFADWYCENDEEREFGARRHALCCQMVMLTWFYEDAIKNGKGIKRQTARTIHTLCNPLGLNYNDEGHICLGRFLCAHLFRRMRFKWAVWVYTKIFRCEY